MSKIFISHSSKDKKLVDEIIIFLESSLKLEDNSIRYSSSAGYSPKSGAHINDTIRSDIQKARLIIGVITSSSQNSKWVTTELSAAWGMKKWIVPILIDLECSKLPDPIHSLNAIKTNEENMLKLIDDIGERLSIEVKSSAKTSIAAKRLIEYINKPIRNAEPNNFKIELDSETKNINPPSQVGIRKSQLFIRSMLLIICFSAILVIMVGFRLWEFIFKNQLIIGIGPHHTISQEALEKSYNEQYSTPFISKYKFKFKVVSSYEDMLLDLLRQKTIDIAQVSPNTWLQFKADILPLIDDNGNKVNLEKQFKFLGQKRYKWEDGTIRDYYQSCYLFNTNDDILKSPEIKTKDECNKWNAINLESIKQRKIFLNKITLSTSTFLVPFISLIEKGISPQDLYKKLEPSTRVGMVLKVSASRNPGIGASYIGALAEKEIEQGRHDDVQKIKIPAKIPYDAIVVSQQKWQIWQKNNKEGIIKELLIKTGLMGDEGEPEAYDTFIKRIGSAIITDVHETLKNSELTNDPEIEIDIWVPGPLNSKLVEKGFYFIDLDILKLRDYLMTPSCEFEIISFEDGALSPTFNTKLNIVCKIKPISLDPIKKQSDIMTIRFNKNQLPAKMQESIKTLIGYHVRKSEK